MHRICSLSQRKDLVAGGQAGGRCAADGGQAVVGRPGGGGGWQPQRRGRAAGQPGVVFGHDAPHRVAALRAGVANLWRNDGQVQCLAKLHFKGLGSSASRNLLQHPVQRKVASTALSIGMVSPLLIEAQAHCSSAGPTAYAWLNKRLKPGRCTVQDVAAALEGLAKDVVMAEAAVPRIVAATQPPAVRTEPAPPEVRAVSCCREPCSTKGTLEPCRGRQVFVESW